MPPSWQQPHLNLPQFDETDEELHTSNRSNFFDSEANENDEAQESLPNEKYRYVNPDFKQLVITDKNLAKHA